VEGAFGMAISTAKLRAVFPFFREMDPDLLARIASRMTEKVLCRGTLIFLEGADGEEVYFLVSGAVMVSTLNKTKKVVFSILREGELFGEIALISKKAGRTATVETLTQTRLFALNKNDFCQLVEQERAFVHYLLLNMIERLTYANQKIYNLTFLSVRSRIIKQLLQLHDHRFAADRTDPEAAAPRLTHQQLADMVGAVRETVSKILQELQEEGMITVRNRQILLTDPALLRRKLEEES
jgi:CRP/FNR family transcriptional regulator